MKKLIIFLSLLVGFTISVNASENKTYSEQDVHYDKTSFLMFDKNNSPVSGVIKVFFDDQKIHKEIPYVSGKKHGVETWYWPNGNKRFSIHWVKSNDDLKRVSSLFCIAPIVIDLDNIKSIFGITTEDCAQKAQMLAEKISESGHHVILVSIKE